MSIITELVIINSGVSSIHCSFVLHIVLVCVGGTKSSHFFKFLWNIVALNWLTKMSLYFVCKWGVRLEVTKADVLAVSLAIKGALAVPESEC